MHPRARVTSFSAVVWKRPLTGGGWDDIHEAFGDDVPRAYMDHWSTYQADFLVVATGGLNQTKKNVLCFQKMPRHS
jgi:hypothetical protein